MFDVCHNKFKDEKAQINFIELRSTWMRTTTLRNCDMIHELPFSNINESGLFGVLNRINDEPN